MERIALLLAPLLIALLAACGPAATVRPDEAAAARRMAWPAPPERAHIVYLRSISSPGDWNIHRNFGQRIIDALAGGKAERLVRPSAVAERDGVLCIADPGAGALWIFDASRNRSMKVVRAGDAMLVSPVAVAMRADGSVYVADTTLDSVFLFDRDGRFVRVAASEGLERPSAIAYDAQRDALYVADSVRNRIVVFDAGGRRLRDWGRAGSGDGEFNRPTHLAFARGGALMVTDALNFRVQAFDRDGRFLWKLGHHGDGSGDFAAPKGIAADAAGNVYVADALFDVVQIFDANGTFLLAFGEPGAAAGQLTLPGGIFIAGDDRVFVADTYNARVQVFAALPEGPGGR
ncbi:MAG: 6-bladed beta-propeller [Betaproteobacteria bacterium]